WPILSSGGTTPALTWGGISTSSPIAAASGLLYATGVNTFASVSTSSPLNTSISGNAATVTTNANLTGDVTSTGNATTIGANKVTVGMLAQLAANSLLGNSTGVLGNVTAVSTSTLNIGGTAGNITGIVAIANGGTASSTPLGGILVGNGSSAVKSLVVGTNLTFDGTTLNAAGGAGVTSVSGTYPVASSGGTTPAISLAFGTTTSNTWSGTQSFSTASTTNLIVSSAGGSGTRCLQVAADGTVSATAGACGVAGAGIQNLGPAGQLQSGTTQTLATSTADANLGMTIVGSGNTQTFTPYWIGTLADGRIASAVNWNTAYTNRITSATYPLQISSNVISSAFGTTTSNTWAGTQVFTNAPTLASFTGLIGANGGVSYAISTSSPLNTSISGNAGTVTNGVYTTDTGTVSNTMLAAAAVTYAKLQNLNYGEIIGRNTAGAGVTAGLATSTYKSMLALTASDVGLGNVTNTAQVTSVTGTWPILSSGGTTPALTWGGISTSSPIAAASGLLYATGVNTFASVSTS
ncbi:hypothetical protein KGQ33_05375, partial [Patescibacteria group bacterium]|nr:hypothetical protein [Patescibacteria group bacterium]